MNSGCGRQRRAQPPFEPCRLPRADVPRHGDDTPPRRCELCEARPIRRERAARPMVFPTVALEADLAIRPGEVEAVPASGERYPELANRERKFETRELEPHLRLQDGLQRRPRSVSEHRDEPTGSRP